MGAKKAWTIALSLLALVLVGTLVVLSTVQVYFGVDSRDIISIEEAHYWSTQPTLPFGSNFTTSPDGEPLTRLPVEKIPRIIHQTWKNETLPERWDSVRAQCLAMHPDFEYKLWTDESARKFIAQQYPWFLDSFDNYPYPIQRADAIRYFVLHHYGGVYMDLDIGCRKPLQPLLNFEVILPRTKPVGVSNDLMFSAPRHPFMDLVIHNLLTFNHQYGTNYPTVMFSTGPMFLSAQYGLWPKIGLSSEDGTVQRQESLRILPKSLYGKNALPADSEDSFFWHYYGSSWHADDAGFVTFLGKFGMVILYSGSLLLTLGIVRLFWSKCKAAAVPSNGPIALPFNLPYAPSEGARSAASSPVGSRPGSPLPPAFGTSLRSTSPAPPSPTDQRGFFTWIPVFYQNGEPPRLTPAQGGSQPPRNSPLPSFAYYSSTDGAPPYYQPDSDAASIHSMHTIRKPTSRRKQRSRDDKSHARSLSNGCSDYASTDDDDVESQLLSRSRTRPLNTQSTWSEWTSALFRSRPEENPTNLPPPTLTLSPPPPTTPTRPVTPTPVTQLFQMPPPGYLQQPDADETVGGSVKTDFDLVGDRRHDSARGEVDRLLSEMDPDLRPAR